jgi:hypothetical protein
MDTKTTGQTNFRLTFFLLLDPGSGIWDKHLGSATLLSDKFTTTSVCLLILFNGREKCTTERLFK